MTELQPGSLLGGYQIEALAGRGGMGVVYRATQLALGRTVALKLIAPEFAGDTRFRERFQRESRLAAAIDHPNVIPVYEAGQADDSLFICMRWVDGTDLDTLIRRGGGLEPERAARIVSQIAGALDAAHARGLVHRDVKPANVLIAEGRVEHVYLTDFGLVKRRESSMDMTGTGEFVGTLDYIAPEQIRGDADSCSDVYSLGCVLFHSLTGRVPFETDGQIAKIYSQLNEDPPRPSDLASGLPRGFDDVVARAMAKERAERYPSAGDLGQAAVAAVNASTSPKPTKNAPRRTAATTVLPSTSKPWPALPGRKGLWAGAGLVLGGICVGALALGGVFDGGSRHAKNLAAAVPPDGALIKTRGARKVWVVKAGARFRLSSKELTVFGSAPGKARVLSAAALRDVPTIPREGSLVKPYGTSLAWVVRDRHRRPLRLAPGADAVVIPRDGLHQIPLPGGGREVSIDVVAPASVEEGRTFRLAARVRSAAGHPRGSCVFFRIDRGGLIERANVPARKGRCVARVSVQRLRRARYSVHFYGDQGWRTAAAASPYIRVRPPRSSAG